MKVWAKPVAATVDGRFEVTRYLPSELVVQARPNRGAKLKTPATLWV